VVKPIGFSFSMAPEQNSLVFMKTTVLMVLSLCLASGGLTAQAIAQQTSRSATSAAKALTNDVRHKPRCSACSEEKPGSSIDHRRDDRRREETRSIARHLNPGSGF
jgi:hypothetical protein